MEQTVSRPASNINFSKPLSVTAQVLSYLFHPLFIPIYMSAILLYLHPINRLLIPDEVRIRLMAMVFINTVLFPALIVGLLRRLDFMKSVYMETTKERIIPLTASIIFYFWAFYVSRNLDIVPIPMQQWLLGVFLSSCAAMFVNIWRKISLHSIGVAGFVAFCAWQQTTDINWPRYLLIAGLLVSGLIGTSRLIRKAHEPWDIYAGWVAGIVCQVVAGMFYAS